LKCDTILFIGRFKRTIPCAVDVAVDDDQVTKFMSLKSKSTES